MRGWGGLGSVPQVVCQVRNVADLSSRRAGTGKRRVRPAAAVRFRGHPPNQPLLFSNGRRRKSRTEGKTIYKGYNLGARLSRCIPYGFFQLPRVSLAHGGGEL